MTTLSVTGAAGFLGRHLIAAAAARGFDGIRALAHRAAIPVTVQLRRNPANSARDSDFDAWLSFLRGCIGNYPAKFILIGTHAETDPRFRELANVLIAKDYRTTLEQDLALAEASAIHLGAGSGPGTMAVFSSKPYCSPRSISPVQPMSYAPISRSGNRFLPPMQMWSGESPKQQP